MADLLVTGGAGFIGSNFVHHVVNNTDLSVTVLDKLTYAASRESLDELPQDRVELVVGDVADAALVDKLFSDHGAVVHFAAESHNDNSLDDPGPFIQTNIVGTFTLLEAARRHDVRLHHVSTDEVYGDLDLDDPKRFTEDTPYNPSSPVQRLQGRLRPPGPRVGAQLRRPRDDLELLQQLRPLAAHREVHPPPDHQPDRRRAAQGVRRRAQRPRLDPRRRPLLGGAGDPRQGPVRRDLPDRRRRRAQQPPGRDRDPRALFGRTEDDIEFVTDRAGHDRRYAIESGKLRAELGWSPRYQDFEAGLADTIDWYQEHEDWWRPHKQATEAFYAGQGPVTELSVEQTPIPGLLVVRLPLHEDSRGWFKENWQRAKMTALGLPDFGPVQHSVAYNARRGVTRGVHTEPWDKFISVAHGRIFGAWVDMREGDSFGEVFTIEADPSVAVFVPRGVGNSYQVLEDGTTYSYLVNDHWRPGLAYPALNLADPTVAIPWPIPLAEAEISDKDLTTPMLADVVPMAPRKTLIVGAKGQLGTRPAGGLPGRRPRRPAPGEPNCEQPGRDGPEAGRGLAVERVRPGAQRRGVHRGRRGRDPRRAAYGVGGQRRRPGHPGPARGRAPVHAGALLDASTSSTAPSTRTPRTSRSHRSASTRRPRRPATSRSPPRPGTTCCAPRG